QARAEPAARPRAGKLLNYVERTKDRLALVGEFVHRLLIVAVRVELPAAVEARLDDAGIDLAAARIERHGRADREFVEQTADAPEADAHPILVPAPIGMIGQHRLSW